MRQGAGTFGLGDAMVAVVLVALVLATARVSLPAAVAVAAILGMAGHRVRAVLRPDREAGRPVGLGRLAGTWAESTSIAGFVVILTGLVGGVTLFLCGTLLSGLGMAAERINFGLFWLLIQVGWLAALVVGVLAMGWAAASLRRAYWPPTDGTPPPDAAAADEEIMTIL
jgi:hypothetical protein